MSKALCYIVFVSFCVWLKRFGSNGSSFAQDHGATNTSGSKFLIHRTCADLIFNTCSGSNNLIPSGVWVLISHIPRLPSPRTMWLSNMAGLTGLAPGAYYVLRSTCLACRMIQVAMNKWGLKFTLQRLQKLRWSLGTTFSGMGCFESAALSETRLRHMVAQKVLVRWFLT